MFLYTCDRRLIERSIGSFQLTALCKLSSQDTAPVGVVRETHLSSASSQRNSRLVLICFHYRVKLSAVSVPPVNLNFFFLFKLLLISVLERNSLSVKMKCWNSASKCILFHPYIFSVENWLLHLQLNPSNPELIERKGINFETVLERKKSSEESIQW